jgi:hypothetical protein
MKDMSELYENNERYDALLDQHVDMLEQFAELEGMCGLLVQTLVRIAGNLADDQTDSEETHELRRLARVTLDEVGINHRAEAFDEVKRRV